MGRSAWDDSPVGTVGREQAGSGQEGGVRVLRGQGTSLAKMKHPGARLCQQTA